MNAQWLQNGDTVAGGKGEGSNMNQLKNPHGIFVDDAGNILIADWWNHRIVEWDVGATNGRILAGKNSKEYALSTPMDLLVCKETHCLIISQKQKVIRLPYDDPIRQPEILIDNISCWGVAMDDKECLYVSDTDKHEVRRYQKGDKKGSIVAGGRGPGNQLNQLNYPTYIFVDENETVYVSDRHNHRVMKWYKNATEGIIVAGGQGKGSSLKQLSCPQGLFVDKMGTVYVADSNNHRVMRWPQGATKGTVILGVNGRGQQNDQLNNPSGLSFDNCLSLYVVDHDNQRVQRFLIKNRDI